MDNASFCFPVHYFLPKIPSAEADIPCDAISWMHFFFPRTTVVLPEPALIHRQNASAFIPADLLFCSFMLCSYQEARVFVCASPDGKALYFARLLRGLKDSIENEPERIWNKQMHALVREMSHYGAAWNPAQSAPRRQSAGLRRDTARSWKKLGRIRVY